MDFYETLKTLRAVRRLRTDPIPDAVLRRILEAATYAPSGGNVQPWRIIVVADESKKQALGALYSERWQAYSAGHRALLKDAPEPVREKSERMIGAGDYLADHFGETPVVLVHCFNPKALAVTDKDQARLSVVGGASIYPAIQNLLLACRHEGLGCVLTTLLCEVESEVRELLDIPEPWCTAAAVPVGYPVGRGHGPISRRPVEKMAFADRWGEAF